MASQPSSSPSRKPRQDVLGALPVIGWREWVVIPGFGPEPIKAKVDTGAATSALHAEDLTIATASGFKIATFVYRPHPDSDHGATEVSMPVVGFRRVRSSNGQVERRPVVAARATVGVHELDLELTLTRREDMDHRMLLGRKAVKNRFVVDVSHSYVASSPVNQVRNVGSEQSEG